MKFIAYELKSGIQLVPIVSSEENAIACVPPGAAFKIIEEVDLPSPETRDRWILTEAGIEVGEPPVVPSWKEFILGFAELLGDFAAIVPNQDARTIIATAFNNASQNPQHAVTHLGQAAHFWNRFAVTQPGAIARLNELCQRNHMPFHLNIEGKLELK